MAAEDVSTPAVATSALGTSATTLATASFTPPVNSLLIAMFSIGYGSSWTTAPTASMSGGSLTWNQLTWTTDPTSKVNAAGLFYASVGASSAAMTVTATRAVATGSAGMQLAVRVITGATSPPVQLAANINPTGSTVMNASVTPNAIGSLIYTQGVAGGSVTLTPTANTTTITTLNDSSDGETLTIGTGTSLVTSLTPTAYGWTYTPSHSNIIQIFEVEPVASPASRPHFSNWTARMQAANW